jgi:hypothetical protein
MNIKEQYYDKEKMLDDIFLDMFDDPPFVHHPMELYHLCLHNYKQDNEGVKR